MKRASDAFEQQIKRIYELLLGSGAEVTWDDHIPDPDNPSQPRQIDVTVRRDRKLTLVECREQQSRQDVKWIEELIGRRMSLAADAVIAVSSSGFTVGALKKAKRYGVIPRDLQRLTDTEIAAWGRQIALMLYFYEYSNLDVSLLFEHSSIANLDPATAKLELKRHPAMQSLFNAAARKLGEINLLADENAGRTVEFTLRLQFEGFSLCGEPVVEVEFRGNARLTSREIVSPAVFGYGEPTQDNRDREALIELFPLGKTCVTHDSNRISLFLDVSGLEMPPFCQLRFFKAFSECETDYEVVEFFGVEKLWVYGPGMRINLCSTSPAICL
jgi:hypothetical protein